MEASKVKIHFNSSGSHPALRSPENAGGRFVAMTTASVDKAVAKYLVETVNKAAYVSEKVAEEAAAAAGAPTNQRKP